MDNYFHKRNYLGEASGLIREHIGDITDIISELEGLTVDKLAERLTNWPLEELQTYVELENLDESERAKKIISLYKDETFVYSNPTMAMRRVKVIFLSMPDKARANFLSAVAKRIMILESKNIIRNEQAG